MTSGFEELRASGPPSAPGLELSSLLEQETLAKGATTQAKAKTKSFEVDIRPFERTVQGAA
jgi:hypothetical protein